MLWSFGLVLEDTDVSDSICEICTVIHPFSGGCKSNEFMTANIQSELIFLIAFSAAQYFPVLLFVIFFSKNVDYFLSVFEQ